MIEYQGANFVYEDGKWLIDLRDVDFITMKQNWDDNNFHVKMHIGDKEVRLVFNEEEEVTKLLETWKENKR
tara:strand:+ start:1349 stop:1561 length:213 start_codon:yes stop_codon:yes gene_type:complete